MPQYCVPTHLIRDDSHDPGDHSLAQVLDGCQAEEKLPRPIDRQAPVQALVVLVNQAEVIHAFAVMRDRALELAVTVLVGFWDEPVCRSTRRYPLRR